jgi:predicted hydrocarbon binding protein
VQPIPKSGYYLPNRFALIFLQAMEDVLGVNGVKATLHMANLSDWIDNLPADNLDPNVDFSSFSSLNAALDEIYGMRGGRGLARRASWHMFDRAVRHAGGVTSVVDVAVKLLPMRVAVRRGIQAISVAMSRISDQKASVEDDDTNIRFAFHRCAACWGRQSDLPICHSQVGLLEQALRWISGGHSFRVQETTCVAMGDEACVFVIDKEPLD